MSSHSKHRYEFRKLVQLQNQKFEDWFKDLTEKARMCYFKDEEERIFDQIVAENSILGLRARAFRDNLNLSQLIGLATELEASSKNCTRCGALDHNASDRKNCKARNQKCDYCGNYGHFVDLCNKKLPRTRSAPEINSKIPNKVPKFEGMCARNVERDASSSSVLNQKKSFAQMFNEKHNTSKGQSNSDSKHKISCETNTVYGNPKVHDERLNKQQSSGDGDAKAIESANYRANKSSNSSHEKKPQPAQKERNLDAIECMIGGVSTFFTVSEEFAVNVITKKLLDKLRIKCNVYNNDTVNINGKNYFYQLESRVDCNNIFKGVCFHVTEEIDEGKCFMTKFSARKFKIECD